ncbi:MAG: class I SAM-dependent methyltransferase [Burkholderiaceae bacterium]
MNNNASSASLDQKTAPACLPNMRARLVLRLLESMAFGELELTLPDGSTRWFRGKNTGSAPTQAAHRAQIMVHDLRALSLTVSRGDIGFGEAYMQGLWSTTNLTALLRLLIINRDAIERVIYGQWWAIIADQIRHLFRSNHKQQAKRNISAHYDLGNEFYACWLDPSMSYSSALFDGTGCWESSVDLQNGQHQKIDRAIQQMRLDPTDPNCQVLEIGCGWGGLADRLLEQFSGHYLGLTLSAAQQTWASRLLARHASYRHTCRLQDYRDVQSQFDGIVSIEMFEAVGERYWDAYFQTLARCLKPKGRAVIQTITIDERLFDRYRRGTDFIQRYIFPGGMLPSSAEFEKYAKHHGLQIEDRFAFGQDYARTLSEWARKFDSQRSEIERLGFDENFQRMWRFYLSYCEAGFAEKNLDVVQFTLRHETA